MHRFEHKKMFGFFSAMHRFEHKFFCFFFRAMHLGGTHHTAQVKPRRFVTLEFGLQSIIAP
jgi:hypothetical protein